MKDALKFLGGSMAVYLIVAACSSYRQHASEDSDDADAGAGRKGIGGSRASGGVGSGGVSPGGESSGGMMGTAGDDQPGEDAGPRDSGMLDGMIDPVPDAMADAGSTSGTRLKARTLNGEDGSRQTVIGWYDSQRNENCSFMVTADGSTRCLPAAGANVSGSFFADAACSEELVLVAISQCTGVPRYANRFVWQSDCLYGVSLYSVGAAYTGTGFYVKNGTMCTVSLPSPTTYRYYRLGAEIPASSFVQGTEQVEQ